MISEEYKAYLKTEVWQKKRSERLKIDGYKCQMCGRPFDLEVHHLHYPDVLGTEDVYRDLITLCDFCHANIEDQKKEYRANRYTELEIQRQKNEEKRQQMVEDCQRRAEEYARQREEDEKRWSMTRKLVKEFIENVKYMDISFAREIGNDYCNKDVVKSELFPILQENGAMLSGVRDVMDYFRNRRYEIILRMMGEGKSRQEIQKETGFSPQMIKKVFEKPNTAKAMLINEREGYNEQA